MKRALVLVMAVVCGLTAAFAVMRLVGEQADSQPLPQYWVVRDIADAEAGVVITLSDDRRLRVDTLVSEESARSVALLYPGKTVAVEHTDGCTRVVPLLQSDRPELSEERYRALAAAGHRDRDLAVAWKLPTIAGTSFEDVGVGTPAACGRREGTE